MFRYDSIKFYLLTIILFSSSFLLAQGWVPNVPLEERINSTENVFEAKVIDKTASWDSKRNNIFTLNKLLISASKNPTMNGDTIILVTKGGMVGEDMQISYPSLQLNLGESGIFFLKLSNENFNPEFHFQQFEPKYSTLSFVAYNLENKTAWDVFTEYQDLGTTFKDFLLRNGLNNFLASYNPSNLVTRSPDAVNISSFSPSVISAGTFTELTINGSGFGSTQGNGKVEFKYANNGGYTWVSPISSEYVSWSNTQIKVEVPNGAGSGKIRVTNNLDEMQESSGTLTVDYNILNVSYQNNKHRINLVDLSGGGIEFEFATSFFNDSDAYASFMRALNTWRCSNDGGTGIYFLDSGSTSTDEASNDGFNVIRFSDESELNGALAVTTSSFSGCFSGGIKWYLVDVDLTFDDDPSSSSYSWNFDETDGSTGSLEFDFESVALHELGHAHQISHSISSGDLMHYSIGNGDERRSFNADEEDAGIDVLGWSSGVCSHSSMTDNYVCLSLALETIDFEGEVNDNKIVLLASIQDIENNYEAILERSTNGINFNEIGQMLKNGVKDGVAQFKFEDESPMPSNYYRVIFSDNNGKEVRSRLIHLSFDTQSEKILVFPNPAKDDISIQSSDIIESINICDVVGNKIISIKPNARENIHQIDLTSLPMGMFILSTKTKFGVSSFRFYHLPGQ